MKLFTAASKKTKTKTKHAEFVYHNTSRGYSNSQGQRHNVAYAEDI